MLIDAHQHFWSIARGDYDWMGSDEGLAPLRRDVLPADLEPHRQAFGIDRTVLVQAAPTLAETHYMLGLADATDWVAKVVGWIDFENRNDLTSLERLARHAKFSGVRPMIQDIADPNWMLRDDLRWAFDALCDLDLTFDALGFPIHIDNFLRLFDRHPRMRIVVDHCMKPQIRDGAYDGWAEGMARIAKETSAFCKLSGLATEAAPEWRPEDLRPYAAQVLAAFGSDRVMWGSDWPVLELNGSYEQWRRTATAFVPGPADQAAVFGTTAKRFYRIV